MATKARFFKEYCEQTMHTINLLKINTKDSRLLKLLFEQKKDEVYLENQTYTVHLPGGASASFKLSHKILRRARKEGKIGERFEIQGACMSSASNVQVNEIFRTLKIEEHGVVYTRKLAGSRAVKMLWETNASSLARENDALTAAKHLGAKPIGNYGSTAKFMVMKKFSGQRLTALIDGNQETFLGRFKALFGLHNPRLTFEQRLYLSWFVLLAIKYQVHKYGFVHRDIKPDNILCDLKNGMRLGICDFGTVVMKAGEQKAYEGYSGTMDYVAPEAWANMSRIQWSSIGISPPPVLPKSDLGQKLDVFSAGILIGELLGAKLPNSDTSSRAIIENSKKINFENRLFARMSSEDLADFPEAQRARTKKALNNMVRALSSQRWHLDLAVNEFKEIIEQYQDAKWQKSLQHNFLYNWAFSSVLNQDLDKAHWLLLRALKEEELAENGQVRPMHHKKIKPILEAFLGKVESAKAKKWNKLWDGEKKEIISSILCLYQNLGGDVNNEAFQGLSGKYQSQMPTASLKSTSSHRKLVGLGYLVLGLAFLIAATSLFICTYCTGSLPALYIASIGQGFMASAIASLTANAMAAAATISLGTVASGFFAYEGGKTMASSKTKAIGEYKEQCEVELINVREASRKPSGS